MKSSNITPLPLVETLKDEASLWLSRMDRGLSDDEYKSLQQWIQLNQKNQAILFEMAALWDDLSILNQLSSLFPFNPQTLHEDNTHHRNRWSIIWGMAATILLGIVLLNSIYPDGKALKAGTYQTTYETRVGQREMVSLPDGSSIHLNTNTWLEVSFNDQGRNIDLKRGEAEFHVVHDNARPFIVKAQNSYILAVGTVFNIQLGQGILGHNKVEVLVTEGKILLSEGHIPAAPISLTNIEDSLDEDTVLVVSGQKAIISNEAIKPVESIELQSVALQEVQQDLAWQQGMIVFRGESLTEALAEVSRYSNTRFSITDPQIAQLKIAGYYKAGDIEGLLESLAENFDLSYIRGSENQVFINSVK